ncbi:hypothetical protein MRB53_041440 [Persea americana]|nr:hypothetical protein MRB53_041440 [Persea americana]
MIRQDSAPRLQVPADRLVQDRLCSSDVLALWRQDQVQLQLSCLAVLALVRLKSTTEVVLTAKTVSVASQGSSLG